MTDDDGSEWYRAISATLVAISKLLLDKGVYTEAELMGVLRETMAEQQKMRGESEGEIAEDEPTKPAKRRHLPAWCTPSKYDDEGEG